MADLIEGARKRRSDILFQMKEASSTSALAEYESAYNSLIYARNLINDNINEIFDSRHNKWVKAFEFIQDVEVALVPLATTFMEKKLERALAFMPESGTRYPKAALDQLDQTKIVRTDEIFGQSKTILLGKAGAEDEYQKALKSLEGINEKIQKMRTRCEQEAGKTMWERAQSEMEQSFKETDSLLRLQRLKLARDSYRWHADVMQFEGEYYRQACLYLKSEIELAVKRADAVLLKEQQEAVEKRRAGQENQALETFQDARQQIENVIRKVSIVENEHHTQELSQAIASLRILEEKIGKFEKRRMEIRTWLSTVISYLENGQLNEANQTYMEIPGDFREDLEVKFIYPRLQGALGDKAHLQLALQALDQKNWETALSESKLVSQSDLKKQANSLWLIAQLRIYHRDIEFNWQHGYYRLCDSDLHRLLSFQTTDEAVRILADEIRAELQVTERLEKIKLMKQVDQKHQIPDRLASLEGQIKVILDPKNKDEKSLFDRHILCPGQNDRNIEETARILEEINELEKVTDVVDGQSITPASKGELVDLKRWLENELRHCGMSILGEKGTLDTASSLEHAFRLVSILRRCNLVGVGEDPICRSVIIRYYQTKTKEFIEQGDWAEAVSKWEWIYQEYPEVAVREEMQSVRYHCLLFEVDNAFKSDFPRAGRLLRGQEKPIQIGPKPSFDYSYEEDNSLAVRMRVYVWLEDVNDLDRNGRYEDAANELKKIDVKALSRGAEIEEIQRIEGIIVDLAEKKRLGALKYLGQIARDNQKSLVEHAYACARILKIDPQDTFSTNWLAGNTDDIQSEINYKLKSCKDLHIDSREVVDQINTTENLLEDLKNLHLAVDKIGIRQNQKATYLKNLKSSEDKVYLHLRDLKDAQRYLDNYSINGTRWRNCVASGNWPEVQDVIHRLGQLLREEAQLLPGHPQRAELKNRLAQYESDRNSLEDAQQRLETAMAGDDFVQATQKLNEIERLLRKYGVTQPGEDPFQIITPNFFIQDLRLGKIPYYEKPDRPGIYLQLIVDQRSKNLIAWEDYESKIQKLTNNLVQNEAQKIPIYLKADLKAPTLKMKEDAEDYLATALSKENEEGEPALKRLKKNNIFQTWRENDKDQLKAVVTDIPRIGDLPDPPLSDKAKEIEDEVIIQINRINEAVITALFDWFELDRIDQKYREELMKLVKELQIGNNDHIEKVTTYNYYWDCSKETNMNDFLSYMRDVMAI